MSSAFAPPSLPFAPQAGIVRARFWSTHLAGPLLVSLALVVCLQAGLDRVIADALVRLEGGHWAWRHAPWLEAGLHRGGRTASIGAWLALAIAQATLLRDARPASRHAVAYVLAAVALGTLCVSALKAATAVECPWDLLRYGGTHPWFGLLDARPPGAHRGHCFPAGQASAGYAWFALYFAAREIRPGARHALLAAALLAGLFLGIGQQLRGAHFASHDVASALVCWLVSLALWRAWPWQRANVASRGRP